MSQSKGKYYYSNNCLHFLKRAVLLAKNVKEATVNRALDGSTYPSQKLVHSVFGRINYGGLNHNSLYLGLVLPSGGWQSLIVQSGHPVWKMQKLSRRRVKQLAVGSTTSTSTSHFWVDSRPATIYLFLKRFVLSVIRRKVMSEWAKYLPVIPGPMLQNNTVSFALPTIKLECHW
jgi:hypothetical protein